MLDRRTTPGRGQETATDGDGGERRRTQSTKRRRNDPSLQQRSGGISGDEQRSRFSSSQACIRPGSGARGTGGGRETLDSASTTFLCNRCPYRAGEAWKYREPQRTANGVGMMTPTAAIETRLWGEWNVRWPRSKGATQRAAIRRQEIRRQGISPDLGSGSRRVSVHAYPHGTRYLHCSVTPEVVKPARIGAKEPLDCPVRTRDETYRGR